VNTELEKRPVFLGPASGLPWGTLARIGFYRRQNRYRLSVGLARIRDPPNRRQQDGEQNNAGNAEEE
jgi:hypothetical protein